MFQIQNFKMFWNWGILLLISIFLQVNQVYSVAEDYSVSVPGNDGMSNFVPSSDAGIWGRILDENEPKNPSEFEYLLPPGVKRHMGSVAALSGPRRALQQFNSITGANGNEIRPRGLFKKKGGMYLPPLLRKFYLYDHENTAEIPSPIYNNNNNIRGIPAVKEFWMDNALDEDSLQSQDSSVAENGNREPKTSQIFYDQPFELMDENPRRALARGGWFPRQFRGFVAEPNTWEKRHIGAVARFGGVPHGKTYRERDSDLKRNLAAFRKIQQGGGNGKQAAFHDSNPKGRIGES